MNKETREAVLSDDYVIQVTAATYKESLDDWIEYLEKKGVEWIVKEVKTGKFLSGGRFELWRKMKEQEKEECRAGKWAIQGGCFRGQLTDVMTKTKPRERLQDE